MPVIAVHVTRRAALAEAAWLVRLLAPVAAACRFASPPPVEIRPTGRWGGWATGPDSAPDGRISLSNKFTFWSSETIVDVVVHEWTHRMLQDREIGSHGPEFFCLNAALLIRAAQFFDGDPIQRLSLYDLQDQPDELADEPNWRGLVLNWSLPMAAELAATDASAEDLASVVCARWASFLSESEARRAAAQRASVAAVVSAHQQAEHLAQLTDSMSFWHTVAMASSFLFLFSVWMLFLFI